MSDIAAELAALDKMSTGELAERYAELHGQPCRTRHRAYLIRKVAWRIQANAEGDLSDRARRRAAELANDADVRVMAPRTIICPPQGGEPATVTSPTAQTGREKPSDLRLPAPGSVIVRQYKGRTIRAIVLEDGQFECDGQRFRTLTALAKQITGSHMNGFRFFRLGVQR